jgi:CDP-paratose 2-epimerase
MSTAIVTGSAGRIGSEAVRHFHELGWDVVGIDNDMRSVFFGAEASTAWMAERLVRELPRYRHLAIDIRDRAAMDRAVRDVAGDLELVIHTAAQPSHDWAVREPMTDFTVNAEGTLVLLEAVRAHAPRATFIFTSTNKVYGDTPNRLPLVELKARYELPPDHPYAGGIPETMSIDHSTHSLFGVSKVAADLMVQEYGRYFDMHTVCFRGGCLTGPGHSGAELHGFLAYLMKCAATGRPYTVYGYKAKQVRDNIHSADLVWAFEHVARRPPRPASVYNIGGGREVNCSMLEAIDACQRIAGRTLTWTYVDRNRIGDHMWWVGDLAAFKADYPDWRLRYDVDGILTEIYELNRERWGVDIQAAEVA